MATFSFKVDAEEEALIRYRMHQGGETNLSQYLRRQCTGGAGAADMTHFGRLQKQVDLLTEAVEQSNKLIRMMMSTRSDGLEMQMLAGLYLLLHPSVDIVVQNPVDRYIDRDAVENILRNALPRDRMRMRTQR